MSVFIHHIGTKVPDTYFPQDIAREMMKGAAGDDRLRARLIHRLYQQSAIDKRHSVIPDFRVGAPGGVFLDQAQGTFASPSTKVRNDLYTEAAKPLFVGLAQDALEHSPFTPADVTHVVTVSCTGFFAPGPDYAIAKALCLNPRVERFHLGFMGCYAAFPALRMAQAFCQADPNAVVLVVSVELCTLHLQFDGDNDAMIAASVFADGGAAAVVSARPPQGGGALELRALQSTLTGVGEEDMAWTIGDRGFDIVLSGYVPEILGSNIRAVLTPLFEAYGVMPDDIPHWGVHPGGRAILDKVQSGLGLADAQLSPSRGVLREYGNMSSATVLFVLKAIAEQASRAREAVCAMAFGPGLTVESGLFLTNPGT